VAREQATTLLGWSAEALWLCPADETVRLAREDATLSGRAGETADGEATAPADTRGDGDR
jgi:hypothetical protein